MPCDISNIKIGDTLVRQDGKEMVITNIHTDASHSNQVRLNGVAWWYVPTGCYCGMEREPDYYRHFVKVISAKPFKFSDYVDEVSTGFAYYNIEQNRVIYLFSTLNGMSVAHFLNEPPTIQNFGNVFPMTFEECDKVLDRFKEADVQIHPTVMNFIQAAVHQDESIEELDDDEEDDEYEYDEEEVEDTALTEITEAALNDPLF